LLALSLGVRFWFLIAGIAMAAMGVGALFVPSITRLDDPSSRVHAESARLDDPVAVPASAR
jgi:hypothetical protein